MLTYPHIDPVAWHVGSLTLPVIGHITLEIRWYALAYLTGVLSGWWLIGRLNKRLTPPTLNAEAFEDIMVWAILGIILGGRLGYVLFYKASYYFSHPAEIFKVWEGGMSFHGGLLGVIVAMILFSRKYKIPFFAVTDLISAVAPIGLFLGRLANFVNGELYGRVTDSPLGMIFPTGGPDPRYPSQLFEAGMEGVLLFILLMTVALTTRALARTGTLSGLFLIGYCAARTTAEFFREPDSFIKFLPDWITMGQLLSLPMLIFGLYLLCIAVTLALKLIAMIEERGPLTVAQYMDHCATHYYATHDPFGAQGDFTTSPEISQIFGELIGAWTADVWQKTGSPRAVLCELGPGRGTLMKDALRATQAVSGFHDGLDIRLIETSPVLRKIQQKTLSGAHPRITWHEALEGLPPLPLLLIANEFFDALPIEQYVKIGHKETVRKVTCDDGRFVWQPEGGIVRETSPATLDIMAEIAAHIRNHGGCALVFDYGYTGGAQGDTLQAMKKHRYADPLEEPGEADLTAHVDFAALAKVAKEARAQVHGPVEQGTFLKRLGAELRATALCKAANREQREAILSGLERLVAPHQMGGLFKVMAVTSSLVAPAGF